MSTITVHVTVSSSGQQGAYYVDGDGPHPFTPKWTGSPGINMAKTPKPGRKFFLMLDKETGTTWFVPYVDKKERYLQRYRRRGERMKIRKH